MQGPPSSSGRRVSGYETKKKRSSALIEAISSRFLHVHVHVYHIFGQRGHVRFRRAISRRPKGSQSPDTGTRTPKKKKKVDTVMSCGIGIGRETIRMNTPICWASQAARWRYEAATAISKNEEEGQDLEESTLWHPGMDTLHLSVLFSSFCFV